MTISHCHICTENKREKALYGREGLEKGLVCPICYAPTCRYHLTIVRWHWQESRKVDSAMICKSCKRSYAHRQWDSHRREWIT